MPIDNIDSSFRPEALAAVSDIVRVGSVGSGGNRRNSPQSGPQDQPEDSSHEENSSEYSPEESEAATLTLSAASLELEDSSPSEVIVLSPVEEDPIPLINEMA